MAQVIVVGGGLAGLSAAHTCLESGANVLLIDKNSFLGGNSTKATSGINGALTKTQIKHKIPDSAEAFYQDTAKSARDLVQPELVKVLTGNSASAVEWLQEKFNLDLSLVSRLGGHSFPRTHRGKEKFPGMTITYALMEKYDELTKTHPNCAKLITKARVTKLIKDSEGSVIGVEYEKEGKVSSEYGPVILATGGYAADFAENGFLKTYRPDVYDLPTTNGEHSTGDGHKMAIQAGGNAIHLEKVQVHPTGLVDPKDPDAKVKFLAAEALRGCGGLLLTNDGQRFCDELGHRDYVTGEMWKNKKAPYRLILNGAASKEIEWHCKHYMGRGLMKKFNSGAELAAEMGISPSVLEKTFSEYNEIAKNKNDPYGKKYFHNVPVVLNDIFHVAIVTPVLHYTMGGMQIDGEAKVLGTNGAISGLFGAGEICGGVHGANRLGGSSLLGCVVYGRVAGNTASKHLLQSLIKSQQQNATRRIGNIAQHLTGNQFNINLGVDPNQKKVHFEIAWDVPSGQSSAQPVHEAAVHHEPAQVAAPVATAPAEKKAEVDANKEYTLEEVAKHNTEKDCWVVVNGQVLNATDFLKDHPGGKKAILLYAGKDATEEFNMLHNADVVEKYAPYTIIGKFKK